jgi:hypothetical protein
MTKDDSRCEATLAANASCSFSPDKKRCFFVAAKGVIVFFTAENLE